jgi:hypothetical protein
MVARLVHGGETILLFLTSCVIGLEVLRLGAGISCLLWLAGNLRAWETNRTRNRKRCREIIHKDPALLFPTILKFSVFSPMLKSTVQLIHDFAEYTLRHSTGALYQSAS